MKKVVSWNEKQHKWKVSVTVHVALGWIHCYALIQESSFQGKDLDMCLQLIKRPSLNRGKLSVCLHAFVCDLWRKAVAVIGTEIGNEGHLALQSDFFYLITMSVKSGLFRSRWQNSRQVEVISMSSTILLLNLAKQIKNPFFSLLKHFLPNEETADI